ncbi:MAG: TIGR00282 family metallophosphoesterase [Candidatus Poribacteria bacterium]|nr:TIGR00282 family metallophosphoesterase [Candidatus Poribacteria bacterium]
MKILFIGDIVGNPGRRVVVEYLKEINKHSTDQYDFIIANGENAAGGKGLTFDIVDQLLASGVSVITSGNHVWAQKEILDFIDTTPQLIRPANYPVNVPGRGFTIVSSADDTKKLGVINLAGQIFMNRYTNPFHVLDSTLTTVKEVTPYIILDFHAEATSEKIAMGWYADGQVSGVVGTHTHVQTADERILPKGTAYITDVGMTGPHDSVIGSKTEQVIESFLTLMPSRFGVAKDNIRLNAVQIELNEQTGLAENIERIQYQI